MVDVRGSLVCIYAVPYINMDLIFKKSDYSSETLEERLYLSQQSPVYVSLGVFPHIP